MAVKQELAVTKRELVAMTKEAENERFLLERERERLIRSIHDADKQAEALG